jgi:hypothetical protein
VLDVIEAIRFGLQLLGRLGVEWAVELDRKLGRIAEEIDARFRQVLGKVNEALDFLDLLIDPIGLLRRVPLLRSLDRAAGYWIRMWWNYELKALRPAAHAPGRGPKYSRRQDAEEMQAFWRTGGGPRAAVVQELSAVFKIALGFSPALKPEE